MRGWVKAGLALMMVMGSYPVTAQGLGNASEGEAFLKAIEEGDNIRRFP